MNKGMHEMTCNHHRNTAQPTLHHCATTTTNKDDVMTKGKKENVFSSTLTLISFNVRKNKRGKIRVSIWDRYVEGKIRILN